MKKMTTVALASLVAISSIAGASRARVNGFGESGTFISDVQDTFSIPTTLLSNADAAYIEAGVGNDAGALNLTANDIEVKPWAGVHSAMFGGVVGLWVGRPVTEFDSVLTKSNFTSGLHAAYPWTYNGFLENDILDLAIPGIGERNQDIMRNVPPGSRIDLLYGAAINERFQYAIGVNYAFFDYNYNDNDWKINFYNKSTGILLGLGINDLGPVKHLDLGLGYQDQRAAYDVEDDVWYTGSRLGSKSELTGYNFRAAGNLSEESSEISAFDVTFASNRMMSKDRAENAFLASPEETVSEVNYSLGYAFGRASSKALGLGGLILYGNHATVDTSLDTTNVNKQESSALRVDVVTGAEGKIKDWFSVRAGISGKAFGQATAGNYVAMNSKTDTYKEYPADASVSTGMTFALGDVSIDTVFNRDFLYTGPYFLSSSGDNLLNTEISATVNFGGGKE